ncbi:glycosyltransferase family 9 protein [Pollutimonas sp. H1-120]|uniref:glycosyltransferase family 9 protein n=1 Tax=Pollutimonas sp. H1-120 TaxID=3148824 RepID=UPI003B529756
MTDCMILRHPLPRRIAVFRALNLGDLLCSIPALRVLRKALPDAWIALVGLDSARPVVERFHRYLDELILFPGHSAFPEQAPRMAELPAFYRSMRSRRFDLVLQMHGSGAQSNTVAQAMAARDWAGFVPEAGQQEPGRLLAWPDDQPEVRRYLSLVSFMGLPEGSAELEFPLDRDDHVKADALAAQAGLDPRHSIFIHAGARLESRRWPVERFAAVAAALEREGWRIVITGNGDEGPLAQRLAAQLSSRAVNLCGKTSLGALASLLQRSRLLICNDTGISHIAAALATPSVVIACGSDAARWAPLDSDLHPVLHHSVPCRPCAYRQCPIGHVCAKAISVDQVLAQATVQLHRGERLGSVGGGELP